MKPSKTEITSNLPEDPEFAEFREIHAHGRKDNIWDNDGTDGSVTKPVPVQSGNDENEEGEATDKIAHKKELSDLEVCLDGSFLN